MPTALTWWAGRSPSATGAPAASLRRRLVLVAMAAGVILLVRGYAVGGYTVDSSSMAPAYDRGDVVVVEKLSRWWRPPARGEVVVVDLGSSLVMKRVVAVAGDWLAMHDSHLVVNGRRVAEPYVNHREIDGMYIGRTVVPDGELFLMGDNRDRSVDSRHFGPVSVGDVNGRVVARLP